MKNKLIKLTTFVISVAFIFISLLEPLDARTLDWGNYGGSNITTEHSIKATTWSNTTGRITAKIKRYDIICVNSICANYPTLEQTKTSTHANISYNNPYVLIVGSVTTHKWGNYSNDIVN